MMESDAHISFCVIEVYLSVGVLVGRLARTAFNFDLAEGD